MKTVEAIYIHIPFCLRKCHYCDFLSFPCLEQADHYLDMMEMEMSQVERNYRIYPKTIFVGGGTPTCLSEKQLERLLSVIQKYFRKDTLLEYTMEANPGTVSAEKFRLMREYGVNRLSLGVQNDQEKFLQTLGRIHSFQEAGEAVQLARSAGFSNISLDFMYGLPGQNVSDWEQTLHNALALKPEHLSLYQLKIEENTKFGKWLDEGKICEFDDAVALEMYRKGQEILHKAGFHQYEISNYARDGRESLHNQVYWRTDDYLGIGLGACSWIRPERWNNVFSIKEYEELLQAGKAPKQEPEVLTESEQMEETVFMALRMNRGVSKKVFFDRFGKTMEEVFPKALEKCFSMGWIAEDGERIYLTEDGRVLGNLVFLEFML